MIKKYTEEQIANAVTNCVETWDREKLIGYASLRLYVEFMDRSRPIGAVSYTHLTLPTTSRV